MIGQTINKSVPHDMTEVKVDMVYGLGEIGLGRDAPPPIQDSATVVRM